jgi:hypothetical protein
VQPESVTTTDVDPSPTVALHVLDRKLEAPKLNRPRPSALPIAVDSGEDTVIVAFATAPRPSTARLPDVSDAVLTLTAASAAEGTTTSAARTSSGATAMSLRPLENRFLSRFILSSDRLLG